MVSNTRLAEFSSSFPALTSLQWNGGPMKFSPINQTSNRWAQYHTNIFPKLCNQNHVVTKKKVHTMCREFFLIILKCALICKYCHIINKRNLDPIRILIYIYILLKYDKIVKYSHPRLISLPRSNKIGMGSGYFIFFFYMVYLFLISIFRKRNVQGDWLPRFLSSPSTLITMWCASPFQPKLISIWFLPSG